MLIRFSVDRPDVAAIARRALLASSAVVALAMAFGGCQEPRSVQPAARDGLRVADQQPEVGTGGVTEEPWSFGGYDGELITTPTHLIHHTLPESRLRRALPEFTASTLDHYRSMITGPVGAEPLPLPGERLSSYVFDTRPEWAAWTKWRLGRSANVYLAIERGGYTIDAESVLWDIGRYDTLCMLAHEGWHQYTQSVFRHPLPAFLEEGLATYAEGHRSARSNQPSRFIPWRNFERFGQLRGSNYRDRLIDLDEIVTQPPQAFVSRGERSLLTYYAQVWVLIHYLVEGQDGQYRDGLVRLLQDAAEGHIASSLYDADRSAARRGRLLGPNAGRAIIATYFDQDYGRFKAGYEAFIQRVVASGNGTRIWQGKSPLE